MRIITARRLRDFFGRPAHGGARQVIDTWIDVAKAAEWQNTVEVKRSFPQTDFLPAGRAIFDLGGNKYRLVAKINYRRKIIYIRFIGTHSEYSRIDAATV